MCNSKLATSSGADRSQFMTLPLSVTDLSIINLIYLTSPLEA